MTSGAVASETSPQGCAFRQAETDVMVATARFPHIASSQRRPKGGPCKGVRRLTDARAGQLSCLLSARLRGSQPDAPADRRPRSSLVLRRTSSSPAPRFSLRTIKVLQIGLQLARHVRLSGHSVECPHCGQTVLEGVREGTNNPPGK